MLQQYLPLAVLKPASSLKASIISLRCNSTYRLRYWNDTDSYVVCVYEDAAICCNSTYRLRYWNFTIYYCYFDNRTRLLQQYLPLAVLKHHNHPHKGDSYRLRLQQYLPLAVLKPHRWFHTISVSKLFMVATVLTACGIETLTTCSS